MVNLALVYSRSSLTPMLIHMLFGCYISSEGGKVMYISACVC